MKNNVYLIVIVVAILCIISSGCTVDPASGERPTDYPGSVWVSNDPAIWFAVNNAGEQQAVLGGIVTADKEYATTISFDMGHGIYFYDMSTDEGFNQEDDMILNGHCKFSESKLIVYIDKDDTNEVIDPSIRQIDFVRKNRTDQDVKDLMEANAVAVISKGSDFIERKIIDGKVYFYGSVILKNYSDSAKTVQLKGSFASDLIEEENLVATTDDGKTREFTLGANQTAEYPILFVGSYTGSDEDENEFPSLKVTEIE